MQHTHLTNTKTEMGEVIAVPRPEVVEMAAETDVRGTTSRRKSWTLADWKEPNPIPPVVTIHTYKKCNSDDCIVCGGRVPLEINHVTY